MYEKGLVSVVIPTYKRSEKLERAVNSVLAQTYKNIEVLVVSDNEPDDEYTAEAKRKIDSLGDSRARLILQEHHKNGAAARNAGIRAASGEYVAFLDDDDYWEKDKIQLQVEQLLSLDETWGGVCCKNKAYVDGKLVAALLPFKDGWVCKGVLARMLHISTDTILLRHNALDDAGYFDENLKRHQEVQLMGFFTQKYKIKLLNMYLVCVDSTTNENQPSPDGMKAIKEVFFQSLDPVLQKMSAKDRRDIEIMNAFELGTLYLQYGNKREGLKLCMRVFSTVRTPFYTIEYVMKKLACRWFAKWLVKHDDYSKVRKLEELTSDNK